LTVEGRIAAATTRVSSVLRHVIMTLPAFAAERREEAPPLLSAGACRAVIDRYLLPTRRSAANPPRAAAAVDR